MESTQRALSPEVASGLVERERPAVEQSVAITVLVPCFNEVDCVGPLTDEIESALDRLEASSEILFVDDASVDGTSEALDEIRRRHPRVRVLAHARNCGQSAAQATGFRSARGAIVVTMDGDGQNDPADIPRLIERLEQGVDVDCGVRRNRRAGDGWVKRVASKIGNGFRNAVTGDRVTDAGCCMRAIRAEALAEVPAFNGMHRFLPTLLRAQGWSVAEVDVNHRPRSAGKSKYGVHDRLWRGIVDCLAVRWFCRRAVSGHRVSAAERAGAPPAGP